MSDAAPTTITEMCTCGASFTATLPSGVEAAVKRWREAHYPRCPGSKPDRSGGTGFAATESTRGRPHEARGHIELDVRA